VPKFGLSPYREMTKIKKACLFQSFFVTIFLNKKNRDFIKRNGAKGEQEKQKRMLLRNIFLFPFI
jgi:hypothetical protein